MIQQVFTNILRNATDALRVSEVKKRRISMTVSRTENTIKIEIRDNGQGLVGKNPEELFSPFNSSKSDGMGIGLSICHSFVELHQGRIWITENSDIGCTAHILLRCAK